MSQHQVRRQNKMECQNCFELLFSLNTAAPSAQSKQYGINFSRLSTAEEIKGVERQPAGFKLNSPAIT
jgi:hypothetical protein